MNGLTLAYIGDSYYELKIREYLIKKGYTNVDILHKKAIKYTSGASQAEVVSTWIDQNHLTPNELKWFYLGRNKSSSKRKNIDAKTHGLSSGFEAIIGGLYLNDINKCNQLISDAINYIEKGVLDIG